MVTKADASSKVGIVLMDEQRNECKQTVIDELRAGGLAEAANLPIGAVVLAVNGVEITGTNQALGLLKAASGAVEITVEKAQDVDLTVVVSTSSSRLPSDEQLAQTSAVLLSLHAAFPHARKLLVCDALPTQAQAAGFDEQDASKWREAWQRREAYSEYCAELAAAKSSRVGAHWRRVELLKLASHGHLVGTVRAALATVATSLVLITQHDLVLDAPAVARAWSGVESALRDGRARCVTINRDMHSSRRSEAYWHFEPDLDLRVGAADLTAVVGFSDQVCARMLRYVCLCCRMRAYAATCTRMLPTRTLAQRAGLRVVLRATSSPYALRPRLPFLASTSAPFVLFAPHRRRILLRSSGIEAACSVSSPLNGVLAWST